MKVELIKQTTKYTGLIYYYTSVDGVLQTNTWTSDPMQAGVLYERVKEQVKQYPENLYETVKVEEV